MSETEIVIVVPMPLDGESSDITLQLVRAMEVSCTDVNKNDLLLPAANLRIEVIDFQMEDSLKGLDEVINMAMQPNVIGIAGPYTSQQSSTLSVAMQSLEFSKPVISATAKSPTLSDTKLLPLFGRLTSSDVEVAQGMYELIKRMGFMRIAVFGAETEFGLGLTDALVEKMENGPFEMIYEKHLSSDKASMIIDIDRSLKRIRDHEYSIIVYNGHHFDTLLVIERAIKLGMISTNTSGRVYQWIIASNACSINQLFFPVDYCPEGFSESECLGFEHALTGMLCVDSYVGLDKYWQKMRWNPQVTEDMLSDDDKRISGLNDWTDDNMLNKVPIAYDIIQLYAVAATELCGESAECYNGLDEQGELIHTKMRESRSFGASGLIMFTEDFDRIGEVVFCYRENYLWREFGSWDFGQTESSLNYGLQIVKDVLWANGLYNPPEDVLMVDTAFEGNTIALVSLFCGLCLCLMTMVTVAHGVKLDYRSFLSSASFVSVNMRYLGAFICLCALEVLLCFNADPPILLNAIHLTMYLPLIILMTIHWCRSKAMFSIMTRTTYELYTVRSRDILKPLLAVLCAWFFGTILNIIFSADYEVSSLYDNHDFSDRFSDQLVWYDVVPSFLNWSVLAQDKETQDHFFRYSDLTFCSFNDFKSGFMLLASNELIVFGLAIMTVVFAATCRKKTIMTRKKAGFKAIIIQGVLLMVLCASSMCFTIMVVINSTERHSPTSQIKDYEGISTIPSGIDNSSLVVLWRFAFQVLMFLVVYHTQFLNLINWSRSSKTAFALTQTLYSTNSEMCLPKHKDKFVLHGELWVLQSGLAESLKEEISVLTREIREKVTRINYFNDKIAASNTKLHVMLIRLKRSQRKAILNQQDILKNYIVDLREGLREDNKKEDERPTAAPVPSISNVSVEIAGQEMLNTMSTIVKSSIPLKIKVSTSRSRRNNKIVPTIESTVFDRGAIRGESKLKPRNNSLASSGNIILSSPNERVKYNPISRKLQKYEVEEDKLINDHHSVE